MLTKQKIPALLALAFVGAFGASASAEPAQAAVAAQPKVYKTLADAKKLAAFGRATLSEKAPGNSTTVGNAFIHRRIGKIHVQFNRPAKDGSGQTEITNRRFDEKDLTHLNTQVYVPSKSGYTSVTLYEEWKRAPGTKGPMVKEGLSPGLRMKNILAALK